MQPIIVLLKNCAISLVLVALLYGLSPAGLVFAQSNDAEQELAELQQELKYLLLQQNSLRDEISQLQVDEQYIEKIAREKFMMVLPGEKVYRVQEQKQLNINNK